MSNIKRIKEVATAVHRLEQQLETIKDMANRLADAEQMPVRYEMKILPPNAYRIETSAVTKLRSLLSFDLDSHGTQHQFDRGTTMIADMTPEEALCVLQTLLKIRDARRIMLKAELENLLEDSL